MDQNNIVIYFFIYDDAIDVAKQFGWSLDENGELHPKEKKFIQMLVNHFKHHGNLIWCVMEEGQEIGESWRQHISKIAEAINEADEYHHIIASHQLSGNVFFHKDDPFISQFAIQTNKEQVETTESLHQWLLKACEKAEGQYSLVMSEDWVQGNRSVPNSDRMEIRQRNWAAAMSDAYSMVLGMDVINTPEPWLNDCRVLQKFFESTTFNQMQPDDSLAFGETKYVLANKNFDYLLYSRNAKTNLGVCGLPKGKYTLSWLDCITGKKQVLEEISEETNDCKWLKPNDFGNEIALFVFRNDKRPVTKENIPTGKTAGKDQIQTNIAPSAESYKIEVK
jgi:hypothetical protein